MYCLLLTELMYKVLLDYMLDDLLSLVIFARRLVAQTWWNPHVGDLGDSKLELFVYLCALTR